MILKDLKIFSQNVQKNNFIINTILEVNYNFWLMNIYSDSSHSALKYLKDTEANIQNLLIMTSNFNIYDSSQDPSFSHHSSINNNLIIIVDYFNLDLSSLTNQVPTRYSDTPGESNSIINLMFL